MVKHKKPIGKNEKKAWKNSLRRYDPHQVPRV